MEIVKNFDDIKVGGVYELYSYDSRGGLNLHLIIKCIKVVSSLEMQVQDIYDFIDPPQLTTWVINLTHTWVITIKPIKNTEVYKI